jgi:predicted transglutaminase-like cysteine proteinase
MDVKGTRGHILTAVLLGLTATGHGFHAAEARSGAMLTGGSTSQPIGHFAFCKTNPEECAIRSQDISPQRMSEEFVKRIAEVNLAVNQSVKPMSDLDRFGKEEVWTYPDQAGDCEDYVLQKRRALAEEGIALSNLLITVVRKPDGESHAVLTVRTDEGDLVLDNLRKAVLRGTRPDTATSSGRRAIIPDAGSPSSTATSRSSDRGPAETVTCEDSRGECRLSRPAGDIVSFLRAAP